ncbi:MAG TPA: dihydroorotate dehydrogenase electron transfer subunit [Bacteroidota bacterium]
MKMANVIVSQVQEVADRIFVLTFESSYVAETVRPGQFLNIRVHSGSDPLFRRPFSVSRIEGNKVEILFGIVGKGTAMLAAKRPGDVLNVLGPLGVPFGLHGSFTNAILIAGGLGVAPMPILTTSLKRDGKRVETFLGAQTSRQLAPFHLENVHNATDDGSKGFHGTVVGLAEQYLKEHPLQGAKMFACGPTAMLRAVSAFASKTGVDCELSLEGDMACGVGICQGCPIERVGAARKYALVCVDGPAFNSKDVIFSS